ncbi:MAG TPA: hypothetical protein DDW52_06755 [Planctomycetaceae bacterium]|nr:hypothetical protein [Planctomycetaceae bacterium]
MASPEYMLGRRFVRSLPKRDPLRIAAKDFRDGDFAAFAAEHFDATDRSLLVARIWLRIRESSQLDFSEFCELTGIQPIAEPHRALAFVLGMVGGA